MKIVPKYQHSHYGIRTNRDTLDSALQFGAYSITWYEPDLPSDVELIKVERTGMRF